MKTLPDEYNKSIMVCFISNQTLYILTKWHTGVIFGS